MKWFIRLFLIVFGVGAVCFVSCNFGLLTWQYWFFQLAIVASYLCGRCHQDDLYMNADKEED